MTLRQVRSISVDILKFQRLLFQTENSFPIFRKSAAYLQYTCLNSTFLQSKNVQHNLTTLRWRYTFINPKYVNSKPFSAFNTRFYQAKVVENQLNPLSPLTKTQANDLVLRLTPEERSSLLAALQEFDSNAIKAEYEAEKVPKPTFDQLLGVASFNAIPFVGFGFLDNFIMIMAGDYIEAKLGAFITLSTMAAAALGNTISDVLGIGSAWYIEMAAARIGFKPPDLSPVQLDMKASRSSANLGRAAGIVVGCLLGMLPLLFMKNKSETNPEAAAPQKQTPVLKQDS